tara:strand:+ start:2480 stop:2713 length:234 start_codon:yes stop_codon:yes gene_type:complete
MFLGNIRLIRDVESAEILKQNKNKNNETLKEISLKNSKCDIEISTSEDKILSPKTKAIMRRNESWDTFIKIQWAWIV